MQYSTDGLPLNLDVEFLLHGKIRDTVSMLRDAVIHCPKDRLATIAEKTEIPENVLTLFGRRASYLHSEALQLLSRALSEDRVEYDHRSGELRPIDPPGVEG